MPAIQTATTMSVAEYSPMKRGLKGWQIVQFARGLIRCRVFPDEEGTESTRRFPPLPAASVAEYSPMKRGLKVCRGARGRRALESCRVFPDEEGTERH